MLLTYDGPAFHSTWNVPRGVWCWLPGLPGSILTGPNVILPLAWSHVMCRARSTHAAAAAGQAWWSTAVSTSGIVARWAGAATLGEAGLTGAAGAWPRPVSAGTAFARAISTVTGTAGPAGPGLGEPADFAATPPM